MKKSNLKTLIILIISILTFLAGCSTEDRPVMQTPLPLADTTSIPIPTPTAVPVENNSDATGQPVKEIQGLVLLEQIDKTIVCDLKYATDDNFTKKAVYPFKAAVLRRQTAEKLARANADFKKKGYRLKVWDAYRPIAVQKAFWELVKDERYVANPQKSGSNHNRGTAVDVTLVDAEGRELAMPSAFDDFSLRASRNNPQMSEEAKKNLELLTTVMTDCGFRTINSEWWHYDDTDSKNYPLLDVDVKDFFDSKEAVIAKPVEPNSNQVKGQSPQPQKNTVSAQVPEKIKNLEDSEQVILVTTGSFESSSARLTAYGKSEGQWNEVISPVRAVIGRNGFSYDKKEGDGKSPIGMFPLNTCYSRTENPGTKLEFISFDENDVWVDDSRSKYYNTFQKGPSDGRWDSAEGLYKIGDIYKYFIVIEYNTVDIIPGKGSAIFLHIWEGEGISTSGCTAMSESDLLRVIKWLDPAKKPLIIQGPVSEVNKL